MKKAIHRSLARYYLPLLMTTLMTTLFPWSEVQAQNFPGGPQPQGTGPWGPNAQNPNNFGFPGNSGYQGNPGNPGNPGISGMAQSNFAGSNRSVALIPMTCFSNMENGHHIMDRGYRFILRDSPGGSIIASGPMKIEAAINGQKLDGQGNSGYAAVVLQVDLDYVAPQFAYGTSGPQSGVASICFVPKSQLGSQMQCKQLESAIRNSASGEYSRQWQFVERKVRFAVELNLKNPINPNMYGLNLNGPNVNGPNMNDSNVNGPVLKILHWDGPVGTEGTAEAPAASCFHPAYASFAPQKSFKDFQSPLVLDLNGDGDVNLVDVWDERVKVEFDGEGDGIRSRTGWVAPQDGLLAIDRNGDGVIGDGRELFGEYSWGLRLESTARKRFKSGFDALTQYDHDHDGKIDGADPVYKFLRVWRDLNQDGLSSPQELQSLSDAGVLSLSLQAQNACQGDSCPANARNEIRYQSTFQTASGATRKLVDVWFRQRRAPNLTLENLKPRL